MPARKTPENPEATTEAPEVVPEGNISLVPETRDIAEMNIFERIAAISREAGALAPESKGGVPFAFRGVDGVVAHVTPFLHKYGVIVYPTAINHVVTEREIVAVPKTGGQPVPTGRIVKTTQVEVSYLAAGPNGDAVTIQTAGLADDFADRSTAQAQSVAYRIALLQLFHLPTHDKEPEQTGQEVMDARAGAASGEAPTAPRGPKAVENAKSASAPAASPVSRLQAEAKALGRAKKVTPDVLNAKGKELSGGKEVDEWFNDPLIMEQIRDWLKAMD